MNLKQFISSGSYLIDQVKNRAEKHKSHFFDADTMRFFSSRISDLCWTKDTDIYFITSEADKSSFKHSGSIRAFTIRKCDISGDITTIGKFQEYENLREARKGIKAIIEKENCSICDSDKFVMPKAGSGTVSHWVCLKCVTDRKLEVLPEYLENIKNFGHWYGC